MNILLNLTTRIKLILSFGLMILLLAGVIAAAYQDIDSIQASQRRLYNTDFVNAADLAEIRALESNMQAQLLTMMLTDSLTEREERHNDLKQRRQRVRELLQQLFARLQGDRAMLNKLRQFEALLLAYAQTRDIQVIPLIYAGKIKEARVITTSIQAGRYDQIRTWVQNLTEDTNKEVRNAIAQSEQKTQEAKHIFAGIGVIALVFSIAMVWSLTRAIANPLKQFAVMADRVAAGDLSVEVAESHRADEVGKLSQSFRAMVDGLRKLTLESGESMKRFRRVIESVPNAIILVGQDGRIALVNAQAEKLFGYSREELLGQPVEMLVPERFRGKHPDYRRSFFANPSVRPMGAGRELHGLRKDGREFPVEIGLNPIQSDEAALVLTSIIDITERKRAEERFRRVVESAPNAIILVAQDGRISLVNAQTEKLFGYSREELLGQPVEMLVPERFRSLHSGDRAAFFANPTVRAMGVGRDLYGLHKDGREISLEIGLNPIQSEEGVLVLTSIIDITERKQAEESIRRVLQEIQETVDILAASTSNILSAASQVAAGSVETATAVSQTTTTVEEVRQTAMMAAEKAQHVSDSARKTVEISQRGQNSVQDSIAAMQLIQEQMEWVSQSIVQLSEQGQTIGEIIATVNDLAEQSNILAVNATIEAAKAGEQGKGFKVVAQEVRSLAGQSKQATVQVRKILQDIQKATGTAVAATDQGRKAVDEGMKLTIQVNEAIKLLTANIEGAAQAAMQIAASTQQQLMGIDQVVLAMKSISQASSQNVDSTQQTEAVAHSLHELGLKLKQLMERS
ncbi:MAG: PAS domain S-box protein [Methylococcaceae bacterium]